MKKKIVIHYPYIPEYRMGIFRLLNSSENFEYTFWASEKSNDKYLLTNTKNINLINTPLKIIKVPIINRELEWQPSAIKNIFISNDIDAYIVLGNPHSISTWLCLCISRIRNIPTLIWSHGYRKEENGIKGFIRKYFYKLANKHLLYGNRAKNFMLKKGFKDENLNPIFNSLDYETQKEFREKLNYDDRILTRKKLNIEENSIVLIVIGRLMSKLKIEQVLESIKISEKNINLIIVGDGPEKNNLINLVEKYQIQDKVVFYGASHNEEELSKLYNASDYSVVMGKVGLAAMHSLAYGIPMITNDNIDEHFPEIEAIIDNQTGFYFKEDDLEDFISKIKPIKYRSIFYHNCISIIEKNFTPENQKKLIEISLNDIFGFKNEK